MPDRAEGYPFLVREFARNDNEVVRVTLDMFRGHETISIRVFYRAGSGEWKPGRSGMSMSTRYLPDLSAALNEAIDCAGLRAAPGSGKNGHHR
jgi:hypothetical protein